MRHELDLLPGFRQTVERRHGRLELVPDAAHVDREDARVAELVAEVLDIPFHAVTAEMRRIKDDAAYIEGVLADGSERASRLARETMNAVKDIVGFVRR